MAMDLSTDSSAKGLLLQAGAVRCRLHHVPHYCESEDGLLLRTSTTAQCVTCALLPRKSPILAASGKIYLHVCISSSRTSLHIRFYIGQFFPGIQHSQVIFSFLFLLLYDYNLILKKLRP